MSADPATATSSASSANSQKVRAIYWDIGGVLLTNGWDHRERERVLASFSIDREEYEARHPQANDRWERGELNDEQFLAETVFFRERSFTPQQFIDAVRQQSQWLPGGAKSVIEAARQHSGVPMAMLNNESGSLNDYRIERFGLDAYFDGFYCSAYLGMRKPEPRIFRSGLALLHQSADQSVFIDDREANCSAAAAVGMHAIQYKDEQQLAAALRALGVRLG
jgi:putative hydrolase of the HAD superfamily